MKTGGLKVEVMGNVEGIGNNPGECASYLSRNIVRWIWKNPDVGFWTFLLKVG
jgi:hypothetical protein